MDDERLRQPVTAGLPDYFDELLERIRDIRASEQKLYLRVEDILALAADYQPSDARRPRRCSKQCKTSCPMPSRV